MSKAEFQIENERLLEKVTGVEARSFLGWRLGGRWVKKGEKQKTFTVQSGVRRVGTNPITGEDEYAPNFKTCYGFTKDQTN